MFASKLGVKLAPQFVLNATARLISALADGSGLSRYVGKITKLSTLGFWPAWARRVNGAREGTSDRALVESVVGQGAVPELICKNLIKTRLGFGPRAMGMIGEVVVALAMGAEDGVVDAQNVAQQTGSGEGHRAMDVLLIVDAERSHPLLDNIRPERATVHAELTNHLPPGVHVLQRGEVKTAGVAEVALVRMLPWRPKR